MAIHAPARLNPQNRALCSLARLLRRAKARHQQEQRSNKLIARQDSTAQSARDVRSSEESEQTRSVGARGAARAVTRHSRGGGLLRDRIRADEHEALQQTMRAGIRVGNVYRTAVRDVRSRR
jgi:hypothetical protein